jgi:hypothetical protein
VNICGLKFAVPTPGGSPVSDSATSSAKPLSEATPTVYASELRLKSGHIGFVAGRQAAKVARPQIADWIRRRSDEV